MSRKKHEAFDTQENREAEISEEEKAAETTEPEAAETEPAEEKDPAQQALDEANAKAAEYLALAQRVQADFENYRRRNQTVQADAFADGRRDVAAMMLPVLDNLERAVNAASGSQ